MAITVLTPLKFAGGASEFVRAFVSTKAELKGLSTRKFPDVYEVLCKEDGCKYRLNKANTSTDDLGKWRKVDLDASSLPDIPSSELGQDITINKIIGALPSGSTIPSSSSWQEVIKLLTTGSAT